MHVITFPELFGYLIFTGPEAPDNCTIYSPSLTTNGGVVHNIGSGTQNVILDCTCICRRNNVAVGPATWFDGNTAVTTTASGSNIIIYCHSCWYTYGCENRFSSNCVTIELAISGM